MRRGTNGSAVGEIGLEDFAALTAAHLDVAWRVASYLTSSASEASTLVEWSAARGFERRAKLAGSRRFKLWFLAILLEGWRQTALEAVEPTGGTKAIALGGISARVAAASVAGPFDPARAILDRVDPDDLKRALARLPLDCRVVTTVSLADDLSYQEIGAIVGAPAAAVRARLHRGRALLKLALWQIAVQRGLPVSADVSADYAD